MRQSLTKTSLFIFLFLVVHTVFAQKFEAESATLAGGATLETSAENSGGKFVSQKEGSLTFNLTFAESGSFNIFIQVAAPFGDKINHFIVDGTSVDFSTPLNASYIRLKVVSALKLSAGTHKVEITKSWGWINIDYIEFEKVDVSNQFNTTTKLITPNPTDETVRLYQFLLDNYRKKIISGVSTVDDAIWLKTNTGKNPALVGLDYLFCNRGYTWYNENDPLNQGMAWYNNHGIVTFSWHWRDPSRKTEEFYTANTTFDVNKIFDESSDEYKAMIKDIDYISGLLKRFQDAKVPILWRPLHEAAGGWFWWGAKGAAPCKKLWKIMFDRMVNVNGVRNLIWVWTHEPNDDAWYPGDTYVDIVGRDIYKEGDHSSQIIEFTDMNARYSGKKIVTISESGSFPDVDNLIKDEAGWSWFMVWNGDFTRNAKYNSLDLWKKMFASDYVITLDEMPDLRTYTSPNVSTGIAPELKDEIEIFPTCTGDFVNIQSHEQIQSVAVYNQLGIQIKRLKPEAKAAKISLAGLPSGMYFIIVNQHSTYKIFKQ